MSDHDHAENVRRWGTCFDCTLVALAAQEAAADPAPRPATTGAPHFDGATYRAPDDHERLTGQLAAVFKVMEDSSWRTLGEIARLTSDPESSVSARLRDLRKPKHGEHKVERRHRGPAADGLYEYRVIPAGRLL